MLFCNILYFKYITYTTVNMDRNNSTGFFSYETFYFFSIYSKVIFLISQNTGFNPFLTIAWVVDAKVKGVVITSPVNSKASIAHSCQMPVGKQDYIRNVQIFLQTGFQFLCFSPTFVSQNFPICPLFHLCTHQVGVMRILSPG